ncbi:glycosyltransferase family 4 protein [Sphingomonas montana]|uniref:glycosyltransferase family 4 protein n=1 Tax=Sphingomonas montana TaxID=1843236 RepID=UPI00096FE1F1|nr:glycosyltransferase family 4 protein [Sphingomonas montana]
MSTGGGRPLIAVIGLRGVPDVIGGIETHCEQLYPALADLTGFRFVLLARRAYLHAPRGWLGRAEIVGLHAPRGMGLEAFSHTLVALFYAWWRIEADIVHLHGIGPAIFAPLARLLGLRVIVTHHAADFRRPKWGVIARGLLLFGEAMAARFAHRVICVSHALQADFLGRHPCAAARTLTIRHGAMLTTGAAGSDRLVLDAIGLADGGYMLAVGRLEQTKRFEDLIAAHARLGDQAMPLVIVGTSLDDEGYGERLRAMAGGNVRFVGFRHGLELAALYRGTALFLHASAMEGFGLVVLEALAGGARIALSDIPVHREFGLPDACYFPVGELDRIAGIMTRSSRRTSSWGPGTAIAREHGLSATVGQHAAVMRSLAIGASQSEPSPATNRSNNAQ